MDIALSSFLSNLRDYLQDDPRDHNHQILTFGYLRRISDACSIEDKDEAELIKNFLNDEIKPIIKQHQETEYCLTELCQIENGLDIVLQEQAHSDELIKARQPGKFSEVLFRLMDDLKQLQKGVLAQVD